MSKEIKMPQISEDADSGTIVEILVSEGDTIEEEQSIIAVESDKASVEVPAEAGGKVKKIKVSEGDEINVGDVILILESENEDDEEESDEASEDVEETTDKKKKDKSEDVDEEENKVDDEDDEEESDDATEDEEETTGKKKKNNGEDEDDEELDDDGEQESKSKKKKEIDEGGDVEEEEEDMDDDYQESDTDEKDSTSKKKNKDEEDVPEDDSSERTEKTDKKSKKEVPAAPSVRRLAREMDVDIYALKGSGPGKRITTDDVKAAADGASQKKGTRAETSQGGESTLPDFTQWGDVERQKMSGIHKATAKSMGNAWRTVPHVTQFDKADISTLEDFMEQYESKAAKAGAKLTITAVLVKLSASALRAFPQFNASADVENQEMILKKYINIGVAVDTENGLLVPVIKDADRKSVTTIALELNEVASKAREGKLSGDGMKGGTFTVSNLGGIGGTHFTPIVYHPQVAILGVSRNQVEPVYQDGEFVPKTMLPLSLSYDHRAIDGAEAARFLRWMCQVMEDPFVMLMEGGI